MTKIIVTAITTDSWIRSKRIPAICRGRLTVGSVTDETIGKKENMRAISGEHRGVYWYRHHWGLELAAYNASGYRISRKYVGNGCDRVNVRESVADFRRYIREGGR